MKAKSEIIRLFFALLVCIIYPIYPFTAVAQGIFPYFSDFESDDGGLTATGSWEWGVPFAGPDTAHSDFLLWGTNLSGSYPDNTNDFLELPPIDLSNTSSARLTFWHWYEIEVDEGIFFDGANVKISVNGGPFEVIVPFRGYDGVMESDNPLDGEPVFGGLDKGKVWQKEVFNLQQFLGNTITIRFHLGTDGAVTYSGWYIDDVSVEENLANDLAVWSIEAPGLLVDANLPPVEPVVNVYNAGSQTQSFETEVIITLDGAVDYVSSKTTLDLAPDEQTQVAFDPWTPSKSSGRYELSARTLLPGDEDFENDTLSITGEVFDKDFSDVTLLAVPKVPGFVGGAVWGDYNGDGFVDLCISHAQDRDFSTPIDSAWVYLFKNNGDGTFHRDVVLATPDVFSADLKWGDYDNDGDLDLFVAAQGRRGTPSEQLPGYLFRNDAGNFIDVRNEVGFKLVDRYHIPQEALWLDYDNDGYLDLWIDYQYTLVDEEPRGTDHFYHNKGDGTFEEVLADVGLDYPGTRSGTAADYDDDGFTDLLLWSPLPKISVLSWPAVDLLLFHNKGDGTFEEVATAAGLGSNDECNGAAFGDYDNDGKLDLYVLRGDFWKGPRLDRLFKNNGDGTFTDVAMQAGVSELHITSGSHPVPSWADYDNDGHLDLLTFENQAPVGQRRVLRLYHNHGDGTFSLVDAFPEGGNPGNAAWTDYDNDGDLDLLVNGSSEAILYRNNNNENGWLIITLLGTQSNKNGYGARVRLQSNGLSQVRQINGGSGPNQHDLRAHFGLGKATIVDSIEVRWPSGQVDLLTNVGTNQFITIEEGNGPITGVAGQPFPSSRPKAHSLAHNYPNPFNPQTRILFQIAEPVQVRLDVYNLLGQEVITLIDERRAPGEFVQLWDGNDRLGKAVPSGVYVYRLEAGEFVESRKMLLLR